MDPDGEIRLLAAEVTLLEGCQPGFSVLVLFACPEVPPCTPPMVSTVLITGHPSEDCVRLNDLQIRAVWVTLPGQVSRG